jgi:hypothetical protein
MREGRLRSAADRWDEPRLPGKRKRAIIRNRCAERRPVVRRREFEGRCSHRGCQDTYSGISSLVGQRHFSRAWTDEFEFPRPGPVERWGHDLALSCSEAPAERCGSDSRRLVSFFQFRRSPGLPHLTVLRMRGTTGFRYGERAGSCEASGMFSVRFRGCRGPSHCAVCGGAKVPVDHGRGHSERGWAFRRGVNRSR